MRLLHSRVVFMLGPEANHFVTVGHPENFHWRESSFGDLIPLLGDGLLTIDEDYHDRARAIMMPAFHREQIAAAVAAMATEAEAAIADLPLGEVVDVYDWMRNLAMRIAMRALLGLDPDEAGKGAAAAEHFERALGYYGIDFQLRLLRGPGSPWRKMTSSRRVLDEIVFGEVARRRADPDPGRRDILSLLVGARGEGGEAFSDREIRDQVMTLMFAGHDTSTSTLTFMLHELARHPEALARLHEEQDRVLGGEAPTVDAARTRDALPRDGPRRGAAALPAGLDRPPPRRPRVRVRRLHRAPRTPTSTTAPGPATASPRSSPTRRPSSPSASPASARRRCRAAPTSPSAAAPRICIGKRFGQTEVKLVATMLLQRLRLDALPGRTMTIRQMPTLSPVGGLRMRVNAARRLDSAQRCARWSSPTPTSAPGPGATCCGRSSSSSGWRPARRHRRADLPRRPLRLPLRLGRGRGRRRPTGCCD